VNPIIKWPGGKGSELPIIRPLIPAHARFVEPFAGGAALYLALEPTAGILNDVDAQLIDLYRRVGAGTQNTRDAFLGLLTAWEASRDAAEVRGVALRQAYQAGSLDAVAMARDWASEVARVSGPIGTDALARIGARALTNKANRLGALARRAPISDPDLERQLATGLLAGFYTCIRDAYAPADPDQRAAAWWFLREMCYGSMFRFNRAGHFNIPYGGASYNRKDLRAKVEALLSPAAQRVFAAAELHNQDFRAFFAAYGVGRPHDFVFLDPPYDSEFSGYSNHPFNQAEQRTLAEIIAHLVAPAMLVIKDSAFIRGLYEGLAARDPRVGVSSYAQIYSYNVRGRNVRAVDHLLITNFVRPALPSDRVEHDG
jgi:DNA adenine methylase